MNGKQVHELNMQELMFIVAGSSKVYKKNVKRRAKKLYSMIHSKLTT